MPQRSKRRPTKSRLSQAASERRKLLKVHKRLKGPGKNANHIRVVVRVRPLSRQEANACAWPTVDVSSNMCVLKDPRELMSNDPLLRSRDCQFAFDVSLGPDSTQSQVYQQTGAKIIDQVIGGRHGTIFAYGATGSGKTFSMAGSEKNPGVMYHTINSLFEKIGQLPKDVEVDLQCMYLEIYNEEIKDLLNPGDHPISLREDPILGVCVSGVTHWPMKSAQDVFTVLSRGAARRATDSHRLNNTSSRSHAVLQIKITQRNSSSGKVQACNLNMIDLAGSERAKKSGTDKRMLREAAKINRSLLALANCINALGKKRRRRGGNIHIPYRDSKLTRLLKDSLQGGAYTVMIATVSPSSSQFDETRETLLYANRAKNLKVRASVLNEYAEQVKAERKHIQQFPEHSESKEVRRNKRKVRRSQTKAAPAVPLGDTLQMEAPKDDAVPTNKRDAVLQPPPKPLNRPASAMVTFDAVEKTVVHGLRDELRALRTTLRGGAGQTVPPTPGPANAKDGMCSECTSRQSSLERARLLSQRIEECFDEQIQVRRSLIELEDTQWSNDCQLTRIYRVRRRLADGFRLLQKSLTATDGPADSNAPMVEQFWQAVQQHQEANAHKDDSEEGEGADDEGEDGSDDEGEDGSDDSEDSGMTELVAELDRMAGAHDEHSGELVPGAMSGEQVVSLAARIYLGVEQCDERLRSISQMMEENMEWTAEKHARLKELQAVAREARMNVAHMFKAGELDQASLWLLELTLGKCTSELDAVFNELRLHWLSKVLKEREMQIRSLTSERDVWVQERASLLSNADTGKLALAGSMGGPEMPHGESFHSRSSSLPLMLVSTNGISNDPLMSTGPAADSSTWSASGKSLEVSPPTSAAVADSDAEKPSADGVASLPSTPKGANNRSLADAALGALPIWVTASPNTLNIHERREELKSDGPVHQEPRRRAAPGLPLYGQAHTSVPAQQPTELPDMSTPELRAGPVPEANMRTVERVAAYLPKWLQSPKHITPLVVLGKQRHQNVTNSGNNNDKNHGNNSYNRNATTGSVHNRPMAPDSPSAPLPPAVLKKRRNGAASVVARQDALVAKGRRRGQVAGKRMLINKLPHDRPRDENAPLSSRRSRSFVLGGIGLKGCRK